MKPDATTDERGERRPRNKANMSEPQEEFIDPDCAHPRYDRDHGDELTNATHALLWQHRQHAA